MVYTGLLAKQRMSYMWSETAIAGAYPGGGAQGAGAPPSALEIQ